MVTYNTGDDLFGVTSFIVDATAGKGNYTTIQSAITAAGAGPATVFIRPGTYTENLTLTPNVNLAAFTADGYNGNVIIKGKCTLTTAGEVAITGIELKTNADFCISITGSAASQLLLDSCYVNCIDHTGIEFTSSSASAQMLVYESICDLGTTGIALYSASSAGVMLFQGSNLTNSGNSSTASSNSSGTCYHQFNTINIVFATTSTGIVNIANCNMNSAGINTAALSTAGTGTSVIYNTNINSGTASCIAADTGTTINCLSCTLLTTNTNAITGAGTVKYVGTIFGSSGHLVNVTAQTGSGAASGLQSTAVANTPAAGMLGETQSSAIATGSAVSVSNNTSTDITNISLTPGVWDISSVLAFGNGPITGTQFGGGPSSTSATLGNDGDNATYTPVNPTAATSVYTVVPSWRLQVTANTTVYLVAFALYSVGTLKVYGRISATRVG